MKKLTDFVAESSPSTAERVQHLFEEYEAHACAEARFVKQVDLFDMYLQAYEYEQLNPHSDLAEFFSTADSYPFESPVKEWVAKLLHVRASPTTTSLLPADSNLNTILKFYLKQKKN
jgi:putative hydrolase of HD superfamily